MKILLCEENINIALGIERKIILAEKLVPEKKIEVLIVNKVSDLDEYLEHSGALVDAVFLGMDNEYQDAGDGIEVAKHIKNDYRLMDIIFYTKTDQLREDIFDIDPIYVLTMPMSGEKLGRALIKLVKKMKRNSYECFVIKAVSGLCRVNKGDVRYIESEGRYINIHTDEEVVTSVSKIQEIVDLLGDGFMQCHKSFVVNLKRIKKLEHSKLVMFDGTEIQVSRKYQGNIKEVLAGKG